MGIRETLNNRPKIAAGVVVGLALVVGALYFFVFRDKAQANTTPSGKLWFTIDDGQTYFADEGGKLPPFDHQGKQAVLCHVYSCDGGDTKFVGYLQRYTPEAKRRLGSDSGKNMPIGMATRMSSGIEVKLPLTGDKTWVRMEDSTRSGSIISPKCPGGKQGPAEEVLP